MTTFTCVPVTCRSVRTDVAVRRLRVGKTPRWTRDSTTSYYPTCMTDSILFGTDDVLRRVDAAAWRQHLLHLADKRPTRRALVSPLHRRVREFVVRELPRRDEPLELETVARAVGVPEATLRGVLDDLERDLLLWCGMQPGV